MLYSYKLTADTGFAPNPFHGFLTLATCKAHMRRLREPGDYIAGFTSKTLCKDQVGYERLVFLMRVTEKKTFDSYWNESRFACKKTDLTTAVGRSGDNIYKPLWRSLDLGIGDYEQVKNPFHQTEKRKEDDLSGRFVLLSNDFFYLGKDALVVDSFKIKKPRGEVPYGYRTEDENEVRKLWQHLSEHFPRNEPVAMPFGFDDEKSCTTVCVVCCP